MDDAVIYGESPVISCDGGDESDGHPHIYLDLKKKGEIICPYCSRHFILKQKIQTTKEL